MNEKSANVALVEIRGAYWPIFTQGKNKQVARVKPFQHLQRTERDLKASYVPCLMSHAMLAPLCLKAECKFNLEPCHTNKEDVTRLLPFGQGVYQEEFEIEEIIDHKNIQGSTMYFIKWKDWDKIYNTWEPRENLEHSHKLLEVYDKKMGDINRLKRKYGSSYLAVMERKKKLTSVIRDAYEHHDLKTLLKLSGKNLSDILHKMSEMKSLCNHLVNVVNNNEKMSKKDCNVPVVELITHENEYDELVHFAQKRLQVLKSLSQWENHINSMSGVSVPVKIENHVDLEGPPKSFTYITDYQPSRGIIISEDPPIGCECGTGCYENRKSCCAALSSSHFAYNRNGTLTIPRGTPVFECNKRCSCGTDCPNRVVQKGRCIQLAIFRTDDGRGWGVRTLERIRKGAFVVEYVGEVITSEEAEQRGKLYDREGSTYLFDLDFDGYNEYTVDAAHFGNIAHFINHSCEPNLEVYVVWINNLDPKLPRIAFFSNQDIRKGEELTFDYKMSANTNSEPLSPSQKLNSSSRLGTPGSVFDNCAPTPTKIRKIESDGYYKSVTDGEFPRINCKCGTKSCRKYLF